MYSSVGVKAIKLRIYYRYACCALVCALTFAAKAEQQNRLEIINWKSVEYVSLYDVITTMKIDNSFDIITQRGKLYRKTALWIYQIGYSVAVMNGNLLRDDHPVVRKNGEVLLPLGMATEMLRLLFPEFSLRRENSFLAFEKAEKKRESVEETDKTPEEQKASSGAISFIVIDPGHGGRDPGAIGHGIFEKDVTLGVSRYLASYLKKNIRGLSTKLTRANDRFVELSKRTEIANRMLTGDKNGIFVSIHVNASLSPKISGFETYFLSPNPSNEEARATSTIENNVIVMENNNHRKKYDDVEYVEALMLNTQIQKESTMLANHIQKYLAKDVDEAKSRGVKKADFYVLRGSLMPAVLVEIGYISNHKDAKLLRNKNHQKKVAEGIGRGIVNFIKEYNATVKGIHEKNAFNGGD